MVTGLCDGGAVCRGVLALGGVADLGGAVCDGRALEDGRAAEDRGALEDGGVFSGGGAVLLVVAIGAACGCGAAPDAPLVMRQPVITITTPAIQASSRRIRITHLTNPASAIGRRGRKGRSAAFHRNPGTYVFA
jgi:hypothetical protein